MEKLRENKPTADVLMTSMRSMGYSFESAVADIIPESVKLSKVQNGKQDLKTQRPKRCFC